MPTADFDAIPLDKFVIRLQLFRSVALFLRDVEDLIRW